MKAVTKIIFRDENGDKFFGEGPCHLLRGIEQTGSLRLAAANMGMAYTKALRLLKNAEAALGYALTDRTVGGASGGGSRLTERGRAFLERYEAYRDACIRANRRLYDEFFPQECASAGLGCVIMASGLGRRFGGNKLMVDFMGKPLIQWAMDASDGLFKRRIVVTRHADVAALARDNGIPALLHDKPHRSDALRLGLEAMQDMDGCLFCPGDQPLLRKESLAAMAQAVAQEPDAICRAAFSGRAGAPVLFPRWTYPELMNLPEGRGGSFIANMHPGHVRLIPVQHEWELKDVDTPADLDLLLEEAMRMHRTSQNGQ